jgi:predicted nucleotidyltransferase
MISNDKTFLEIKDRLVRKFNPKKMYLFGSRALGTAKAGSDYDFVLVVQDRKTDGTTAWFDTTDLFTDLSVKVDCFVYTEAEFENWKDEFSSIPETARNTGLEITLG